MKLLSQQIRDLVQQAPTSSYAIAREAGIDKSSMSRFMNGGRLTMDKLDQLARVLGAVITAEVSLVPRPLEKGRPSQTKVEKPKMKKHQAQEWADHYAQDAHSNYFSSRRGVWYLDDLDCLLIYNNNPWSVDESIRDREMKRIERRLKEIGIKTLARGTGGEGYTVSLLIDCSRDRLDQVVHIGQEAAEWAYGEVVKLTTDAKK
jgi:transcriptional regulator with XRE-family HTH domain